MVEKVNVFSKRPLTEQEKEQIAGILHESKCPNESLRATFTRYSHMDGDDIFFDEGGRTHKIEIEI